MISFNTTGVSYIWILNSSQKMHCFVCAYSDIYVKGARSWKDTSPTPGISWQLIAEKHSGTTRSNYVEEITIINALEANYITSCHAFYLSLPVLLPIKSNPKLKALHFTLALKFHVILIKVGLS